MYRVAGVFPPLVPLTRAPQYGERATRPTLSAHPSTPAVGAASVLFAINDLGKRDVSGELRDDRGRWIVGGAGAIAAAHEFFGRLGSSVKAGWSDLTPAEQGAAISALGVAVGIAAARGANHLPPQFHARLEGFVSRASRYAASGKAERHASAASSVLGLGSKLLDEGFPSTAGMLRGMAAVVGVAAASSTIRHVSAFLGEVATKLASSTVEKSYRRPSGVGLATAPGPITRRRGYKVRGTAGRLQPWAPHPSFIRKDALPPPYSLADVPLTGGSLYEYRIEKQRYESRAFYQRLIPAEQRG